MNKVEQTCGNSRWHLWSSAVGSNSLAIGPSDRNCKLLQGSLRRQRNRQQLHSVACDCELMATTSKGGKGSVNAKRGVEQIWVSHGKVCLIHFKKTIGARGTSPRNSHGALNLASLRNKVSISVRSEAVSSNRSKRADLKKNKKSKWAYTLKREREYYLRGPKAPRGPTVWKWDKMMIRWINCAFHFLTWSKNCKHSSSCQLRSKVVNSVHLRIRNSQRTKRSKRSRL